MSPGGWLFLVISMAFVWGLTIWCFYKVLTVPPANEGSPRDRS